LLVGTALDPGNQVTLDANDVKSFEFNINHDFKPTTITVHETSQGQDNDPYIDLAGIVNNPIGVTKLTDDWGDIFASPAAGSYAGGIICTDSFAISAPQGNVGYANTPLQLQVVDSTYGPTDPADIFRTIDAGFDAFVDIQGLYREGPVGQSPSYGYFTHIDRISAGHDVNVFLADPVIETALNPFQYDTRVGETGLVKSPDSPNPMTVTDHFRPSVAGTTPTVLPLGIFGSELFVASLEDYDFGSSTDTNTGLIAGNNVNVNFFSQYYFVSGYSPSGGALSQNAYGNLTTR
jgi:hypothetical protein